MSDAIRPSVRRPPVNVEVLAVIQGGAYDIVRRLPRGGYWGQGGGGFVEAQVYAWMPLPDPPKEEVSEDV